VLSKLPHRPRRGVPNERFAFLVCFAALLAIIAILGLAKVSHAAETPIDEPDVQLAEEDGEFEEDACLEAETEAEIEAACEDEEEGGSEGEGESCPLRSAHAHLAEAHNRVKLTIGYTSLEPTPATVQIKSGRTKTYKRHLNRSGVLRLTEDGTTLHKKVVIRIEAVGWAGCPSRRLVLFRSEPRGASLSSPHRKS